MHDQNAIAAELKSCGNGLWSSVECDVKRDRVVVYARLVAHTRTDLTNALAESERVLKNVLGERVQSSNGWLAAVQWSERLCKTFTAEDAGEAAPVPSRT
jgi:hypothetical protein